MLANKKVRANVEVLRDSAKQLGVALPKTRGEKANLELLGAVRVEVEKRLAATPVDERIQCPVCFEFSTKDTTVCPYCGDPGDESEEAAAARLEASTTEQVVDEPDDEEADADEDADEADEATDEEEAEASDEDVEEEGDEEVEPDEEADDEDEEQQPEAVVGKARSVGIAPKGAALAKNVDAALKVSATELDEAINRIVEAKRNYVGLTYAIGEELRGIRDKQLFKARGYTTFKEFAAKELPMARESALQLIAIVEKYSRLDYETIGYTKLRVLSTVTDTAAKTEILDAARRGASTSEVKSRVAEAKSKEKKVSATTPEKGPKITLLGKFDDRAKTVRFCDVKTGEVVPVAGIFTAKGLRRDLYGEYEIAEGVYIRIGLRVNEKNELGGLTFRFVRATETE